MSASGNCCGRISEICTCQGLNQVWPVLTPTWVPRLALPPSQTTQYWPTNLPIEEYQTLGYGGFFVGHCGYSMLSTGVRAPQTQNRPGSSGFSPSVVTAATPRRDAVRCSLCALPHDHPLDGPAVEHTFQTKTNKTHTGILIIRKGKQTQWGHTKQTSIS